MKVNKILYWILFIVVSIVLNLNVYASVVKSTQKGVDQQSWDAYIKAVKKDPANKYEHSDAYYNASKSQLKELYVAYDTNEFTFIHTVEIKGFKIKSLYGNDLRRLSLMAYPFSQDL